MKKREWERERGKLGRKWWILIYSGLKNYWPPWQKMNKQYSIQIIINNIFIDKLEITTCDKYCAILMFQWNQQKWFADLIKNLFPPNRCFTMIGTLITDCLSCFKTARAGQTMSSWDVVWTDQTATSFFKTLHEPFLSAGMWNGMGTEEDRARTSHLQQEAVQPTGLSLHSNLLVLPLVHIGSGMKGWTQTKHHWSQTKVVMEVILTVGTGSDDNGQHRPEFHVSSIFQKVGKQRVKDQKRAMEHGRG